MASMWNIFSLYQQANNMDKSNRKIKVLWIDDNPTQFSEFLDDAFDAGLDINVCKTVKEGLDELQDRNKIYEAIILDANCKIANEDKEVPQLVALSHAIVGIYVQGIDLPWFVYTGGAYEGKDALEHIIPQQYRTWDEKQWYNKPDEEDALFDAIKRAVDNRETTKLQNAYPEAFRFSSSQVLLGILKNMNTKDFERDTSVPNAIRIILEEDICSFLRDHGIYPDEFRSHNRVKECSVLYGADKKNQYVPAYIQRLFHFLSEYANEGSHGADKREIAIAKKQKNDIEKGLARHLNRTGVNALLSICLWCSTFPIDDNEKMKPYHEFFYNLKNQLDNR